MGKRIGVLPVTVKNMPRQTVLTDKWLDQVMDVVARYWSDMSGGREPVIWRVFPWTVLPDIFEDKQEYGVEELGAWARAVASRRHNYDLSTNVFDHVVLVLDDGLSTSGVTVGTTSLVGAVSADAALILHELGHSYEGHGEADREAWPKAVAYGNPFDIMGHESSKFVYAESRCAVVDADVTDDEQQSRRRTGPGMSAAYLAAAGWLELGNPQVTTDLTGPLRTQRSALVELGALRGAPKPGHAGSHRCAIADGVTDSGERLFVEYRAALTGSDTSPPEGRWDRAMPTVAGAHGWVLASVMGNGRSRLVGCVPARIGLATVIRRSSLRLYVASLTLHNDSPSLVGLRVEDVGAWRNAAWAADVAGTGQPQALVHLSAEGQWWHGRRDGRSFQWTLVNENAGFGDVLDQRHRIWFADFAGQRKSQVLMYSAADGHWWLGTLTGTRLNWSKVAETAGFGDLLDGRHLLTLGQFTGTRPQMLFYHSGDGRWWLGELAKGTLTWRSVGETAGFGDLLDAAHRIWFGDFTGKGRTQVLFYHSRDGHWWFGDLVKGTLRWSMVADTAGFGDLLDAAHRIWFGDFTGKGRTQVLFHYSGDGAWWHGDITGTVMRWRHCGSTTGFGDLLGASHEIWADDFHGTGRAEVMFLNRIDGNLWLGSMADNTLSWAQVGEDRLTGGAWWELHTGNP